MNRPLALPPYERLIAHHGVRIDAAKLSGYMMDGDRCSHTPIDIELLPSAVTLFVPSWARNYPATEDETVTNRGIAA